MYDISMFLKYDFQGPLLDLGSQRPLVHQDMYALIPEAEASHLSLRFEAEWAKVCICLSVCFVVCLFIIIFFFLFVVGLFVCLRVQVWVGLFP